MEHDCIIFDMDGTLTEAYIDFAAIRSELRIPDGHGILETMATFDADRREAAEQVLLAHEMAAAHQAPAADGACEAVRAIQAAGLATAVLTRNTRPAMETVLARLGLTFDLAYSREDGPIKPSPVSIHQACRELDVRPKRTACVGDWVYDIEAANAAGCTSILIRSDRVLDFVDQADHVINSLRELPRLLGV